MKIFENRLRFDRIMAVSLWAHFFGPPCRFIGVNGEEAGVSYSLLLAAWRSG